MINKLAVVMLLGAFAFGLTPAVGVAASTVGKVVGGVVAGGVIVGASSVVYRSEAFQRAGRMMKAYQSLGNNRYSLERGKYSRMKALRKGLRGERPGESRSAALEEIEGNKMTPGDAPSIAENANDLSEGERLSGFGDDPVNPDDLNPAEAASELTDATDNVGESERLPGFGDDAVDPDTMAAEGAEASEALLGAAGG